MMTDSLVDYVLERGNKDYGQFAISAQQRHQMDSNSVLFNHRKMLQYLFSPHSQSLEISGGASMGDSMAPGKRISDLKIEQISGQLNYFSEKIHAELSRQALQAIYRKYLNLDEDLYRLENCWLKKRIPDFYAYYFLKFAYANSYTRLHELILSEIENMSREKDSFLVIYKTIEARQVCLTNLRKQLNALTDLDIEQSLQTIKQETEARNRLIKQQNSKYQESKGYKKSDHADGSKRGGAEQTGKSWKNKLELVFESIEHMRKLSCYVVELIKNWKTSIYNISEDPRRYRQRLIFYHHSANYLLKMLWDCSFIRKSILSKHLNFAGHFDPFLIKPVMDLESKTPSQRTDNEDIFLSLIKPSDVDMDKIVKCLIVLAEEEYDEDQQSRFINEKTNYLTGGGQLENRKKFIQRRRDNLGAGSQEKQNMLGNGDRKKSYSEAKLANNNGSLYATKEDIYALKKEQISKKGLQSSTPQGEAKRAIQFAKDKKSDNLPRQIEEVNSERKQLNKKTKVQSSSLSRMKNIRSVDLKKISPYLSRNEFLKKAQQVVDYEHKFRVAHNEYLQKVQGNTNRLRNMDSKSKKQLHEQISTDKQVTNNRIFNKYIEENIRMMDQANKKAFLYKNKVDNKTKSLVQNSAHNYNRVGFHDRKEGEYQRNLHKFTMPRIDSSNQKRGQLKMTPAKSQDKFRSNSISKNQRDLPKEGAKTTNYTKKGTKAIIEISEKGIKSGEKIIEFELSGKKGKNVGQILEETDKAKLSETITEKLQSPSKKKQQQSEEQNRPQEKNLFEMEKHPEIIVLRQQPQKLEELKKNLYQQIKQELLEELKNSEIKREEDLNAMIEEEKQRKLQEIIDKRKAQQEQRKLQEERMRIAQLEKERKKIDIPISIYPVQYAEENLQENWFDNQLFHLGSQPEIFEKMFTNENLKSIQKQIMEEVHVLFLQGYESQQFPNSYPPPQAQPCSFCVLSYDFSDPKKRRFIVKYMSSKQVYLYISSFHQICHYLWEHDPVDQIQIVMYDNVENQEGNKVVKDIREYCERNGEVYEKRLYSNVIEFRGVVFRPQDEQKGVIGREQMLREKFPYTKYQFGGFLSLKAELLSSAINLAQRHKPHIDMNLQTYTNYIYLLEEIFRSYLTPEEIVELRENSTNIRRLKDIFRIVLELQQSNSSSIQQLSIVEGLNLEDLYNKMKEKLSSPYDKYYWDNFYDKTTDNRLLLAILETKLEIPYPINCCFLNDRRHYRINVKNKVLVLKSSVYSKEDIYVFETNNPKIKLFFMQGEAYKLMRIELFIFLNLVFNNIVEDNMKYINSLWAPQFSIAEGDGEKKVKRITDFSISMKKSFFISEEIYFCNNEYIKNGYNAIPKQADIIMRESMVMGLLHSDVEKGSTGMPIYAKLIDRDEYFVNKEARCNHSE